MMIFPCDDDIRVFIRQIVKVQREYNFILYSMCLMNNHYHLLYKDVKIQMPEIIGKIQENYAIYFNAKYNRTGKVFESPFKSKPIKGYHHFFITLSYILNNPVNAHLVKHYNFYKWNFPKENYDYNNLIDFSYIEKYYYSQNKMLLADYIRQNLGKNVLCSIEINKMRDKEALSLFKDITNSITGDMNFDKQIIGYNDQVNIISKAKYHGMSIRQIIKFSKLSGRFIKENLQKKTYI